MQKELSVITKESKLFGQVRFAVIDGKWYAVGKDVATALGYKGISASNAISKHCKYKIKSMIEMDSKNGSMVKTHINLIPESEIVMLIQTSKAKSTEYKQQFKDWLVSEGLIQDKLVIISRKEINFLDKLEQALKPFGVTGEKQYIVLNYRIDYYIPQLNIAIEYDENGHAGYSYEEHEVRQKEIEKELGCKFIRVTDKESDEYNIGLVIKELFNIIVVS